MRFYSLSLSSSGIRSCLYSSVIQRSPRGAGRRFHASRPGAVSCNTHCGARCMALVQSRALVARRTFSDGAGRAQCSAVTMDFLEEVFVALSLNLIPFGPQTMRVTAVYQALYTGWKTIVQTIVEITKQVDHQWSLHHSASSNDPRPGAFRNSVGWWKLWEAVLLSPESSLSSSMSLDSSTAGDPRLNPEIQRALSLHASPADDSDVFPSPLITCGPLPWYELLPLSSECEDRYSWTSTRCIESKEKKQKLSQTLERLRRLWQPILLHMNLEEEGKKDNVKKKCPSPSSGLSLLNTNVLSNKANDTTTQWGLQEETFDLAQRDIENFPRFCVRERYQSFSNFLRYHMHCAASIEALWEAQLASGGDLEPIPDKQIFEDLSRCLLHPFAYGGVLLSRDGIFVTRAACRRDAAASFANLYTTKKENVSAQKTITVSRRSSPSLSPPEPEMDEGDDELSLCDTPITTLPLQMCLSSLASLSRALQPADQRTGRREMSFLIRRCTSNRQVTCRPLFEMESLLECYVPPFVLFSPPPPPREEKIEPAAEPASFSSTKAASGANVFSPEMLVPIVPSYFIPLPALLPRLPAGYTETHVKELFGKMVKHVEMVYLPPMPMKAPQTGETVHNGGYLRLHEGFKEMKERVVDFFGPSQRVCALTAHTARDYSPYRPDPTMAQCFRTLFFNSCGVRNDWIKLRAVIERAPAHVTRALLPLEASHTLLFFAQLQQYFQFSLDSTGGMIRLAGHPVLETAGAPGAPVTKLGRHNTPTPIALSEVTRLLEKHGCVYVEDLERCRTIEEETLGSHTDRVVAGEGSALEKRRQQSCALLRHLLGIDEVEMELTEAMYEQEGKHPSKRQLHISSSEAPRYYLSDRTKREIMLYYGTLRKFLACHHGNVFSLRLAPLAADGAPAESPSVGERRGFACTRGLSEADYVQQIPAEALESPSGHLLSSSQLMVEPWSTFEERRAPLQGRLLASGGHLDGSMDMGDAPSASSSRVLSSAAVAALTLEEQLEYAMTNRDRRKVQKLRRQIAHRNDPESAFSDPDVLFEAFCRYLPPTRPVSLRVLLRLLPTSITDFLPASVVPWLRKHEKEGKLQVFEYKYRHHLYLLRPGLPLPDGALRKTFTDEELVRIIAGDIQQRDPRPSRMAALYGSLPLGAKDIIRTRYRTLQTFLTMYPQYFLVIAESKSERNSLVRVIKDPCQLGMASADVIVEKELSSMSEEDLRKEEEKEQEALRKDLPDELKDSMRWSS